MPEHLNICTKMFVSEVVEVQEHEINSYACNTQKYNKKRASQKRMRNEVDSCDELEPQLKKRRRQMHDTESVHPSPITWKG